MPYVVTSTDFGEAVSTTKAILATEPFAFVVTMLAWVLTLYLGVIGLQYVVKLWNK